MVHYQSVGAIYTPWSPLAKRGSCLRRVGSIANVRTPFTKRGAIANKVRDLPPKRVRYSQSVGGHCQSVGAVYKARELLRSIRRVWGELFAKRGGYFQEVRTITTAWSLFTRRRSHYQLVTPRTKAWEWGLFTRRGAYLHGKGVRSITKAWAPLPMRRSHYYGERSFSKRGGYLESVRAFTTA